MTDSGKWPGCTQTSAGNQITKGSGNIYEDLGISEPEHGEVRRNGGDTYVWDANLRAWVQTRYAEDG